MSMENPQEVVLDVYREILEDPNFNEAVLYDFSRAGGMARITIEQFADAVLPTLEDGNSQDLAYVPPLDVWRNQVRSGYRDLNIACGRADDPEPEKSISEYLAYLDRFSTDFRETTVPPRHSLRQFIPPSERSIALSPVLAEGFNELGRVVIRDTIVDSTPAAATIIRSKGYQRAQSSSIDALPGELELDTAESRDRINFLEKLGAQFGHTLQSKLTGHETEIVSDDPVRNMMFVIDRVEAERIGLPEAIDNALSLIREADTKIDVAMSEQVLALVAKSLKLADRIGAKDGKQPVFTNRVFSTGMLARVKSILECLDQDVFLQDTASLRAIQQALNTQAKRGYITDQQLDVFWCDFVDPEARKAEAVPSKQ